MVKNQFMSTAGLKNFEQQPFSCTIIGVGFFNTNERKTVRHMITYNFSMTVKSKFQ